MAEKVDVDLATLSPQELERLLAAFGVDALDGPPEKLCGGYSSVNYAVVANQGKRRNLLRILVGGADAARRQAGVLLAAAQAGVRCPAVVAAPGGECWLLCKTVDGQAGCAMLHSWVEGRTANKLVTDDEAGMLAQLGRILATLHTATQPEGLELLDVASDAYIQCFMHSAPGILWEAGVAEVIEAAGAHGEDGLQFAAFLKGEREAATHEALQAPGLRRGLLHGDPFLDNLMIGPDGATMLDWDEAAAGPLAYDLACAVVGGCFAEGGEIRPARLRALLAAYNEVRPLPAEDLVALPGMMRANAVLTCWYRWRAFHIEVLDAPEEARESYKEMLVITQALEDSGGALGEVTSALGSLAGAD